MTRDAAQTIVSLTNSFVDRGELTNTDKMVGAATKVLTATGTVETTWTFTDTPVDDYLSGVATFKKASASATLDQEGFRWYNDDGSESAATAIAAQDTNITQAAGTVGRVRMLVNATGDPATTQFKLQYKLSTDGTWSDIA